VFIPVDVSAVASVERCTRLTGRNGTGGRGGARLADRERGAKTPPSGRMTGLYGAAAVLALLAAAHAAARLRYDRSLAAVTPVVCMLALCAALTLTAVTPAVAQAAPAPADVRLAAAGLALLGAWEFRGMLAAVTGAAERPGKLVAVPVVGVLAAGVVQAALRHAVHSGAGALPALASQLVLAACFLPALGRTAVLAWRCARRIPVGYITLGMRAVAAGTAAEVALIAARAGEFAADASGTRVPWTEVAGVGMGQGVAVIACIAGVTVTAWFPRVESGVSRYRMWAAWWRLRPLWTALVLAFPDIRLEQPRGARLGPRYLVQRRVTEIRDAELALRPYLDARVGGEAAEAARRAGLPPGRRDAVVEAAVITAALAARRDGAVASTGGTEPGPATAPLNDLNAETARLVLVAREIRRSPIVRRLAARLAGRGKGAVCPG
jgi:hypothetical protein